MKKNYALAAALSFLFLFIIISCSESDDSDNYTPIAPIVESPVVVDLTKVPYPKLSDYKFFEGALKDQKPALNVLPYEPASSLFTDYAHKKRFVWMPKGTKATYNTDDSNLELPVGAALIKTFYYENVQNTPNVGGTRIIETRIMIRKADGWIFADYVWNDQQTEAILDLEGSTTPISWKDENNVIKSTDYNIPNEVQCAVCHKFNDTNNNERHIPIGIKPQNLNFNYTYADGDSKNQLTKWIEVGYLQNNFSLPTAENTAVNYMDETKSLDLRARSYLDINCAHCHQADKYCNYRPMRFGFSETKNNLTNMGVCVRTSDLQFPLPSTHQQVVAPGNIDKSMLYFRLNTTVPSYRMPMHGRTIIHQEGIELMEQWINSLETCQ